MSKSSIALWTFAAAALLPASGQWLNVPPTKIPRTADGKVDLFAPTPRRADGKPDLTGSWSSDDNRYLRDFALGLKPEDAPMQPAARALMKEREDGSHSREEPDAHCLPQGVPKIDEVAYPWKVIETPNSYVIIYEAFTLWRQIFTDGRTVDPDANPTWMGYSTGKWEGDDFVVDTRGFNGKAWLDQLGRPTTERLHVTERFRRVDYGHMKLQITVEDPGVFTKPVTVTQEIHFRPGMEPIEFICGENNKDLEHLPGGREVR